MATLILHKTNRTWEKGILPEIKRHFKMIKESIRKDAKHIKVNVPSNNA